MVESEGRILLTQLSHRTGWPGGWTLPGGGRRPRRGPQGHGGPRDLRGDRPAPQRPGAGRRRVGPFRRPLAAGCAGGLPRGAAALPGHHRRARASWSCTTSVARLAGALGAARRDRRDGPRRAGPRRGRPPARRAAAPIARRGEAGSACAGEPGPATPQTTSAAPTASRTTGHADREVEVDVADLVHDRPGRDQRPGSGPTARSAPRGRTAARRPGRSRPSPPAEERRRRGLVATPAGARVVAAAGVSARSTSAVLSGLPSIWCGRGRPWCQCSPCCSSVLSLMFGSWFIG